MEILSVGVSSDADHLITPSSTGPEGAIRAALRDASADADEVRTWDLHATATPGDFLELSTVRSIFPESVLITARKGTFGHGLAVSGGWELTAQYLGSEQGSVFPTSLRLNRLHSSVAHLHERFVFEQQHPSPMG
jgi:3-oxoacyl-[acyl-carrier-protein] synthase II